MTDWLRLREKYVSGRMSLRELCEQEGLKYSTVTKHAADEDWVGRRETFRESVAEKARATVIRRRGKREAEVLQELEDNAEELVARITAALEDEDMLYRHLVMEHGSTQERVYKVLNAKNGRDVVGMLTELQALIAGHGNILDKRTKDELKLKRDRLKLDKEKAGLESKDESDAGLAYMSSVEDMDAGDVSTVEV